MTKQNNMSFVIHCHYKWNICPSRKQCVMLKLVSKFIYKENVVDIAGSTHIYKLTGVRLATHQIKALSVTIVLQKRGH